MITVGTVLLLYDLYSYYSVVYAVYNGYYYTKKVVRVSSKVGQYLYRKYNKRTSKHQILHLDEYDIKMIELENDWVVINDDHETIDLIDYYFKQEIIKIPMDDSENKEEEDDILKEYETVADDEWNLISRNDVEDLF